MDDVWAPVVAALGVAFASTVASWFTVRHSERLEDKRQAHDVRMRQRSEGVEACAAFARCAIAYRNAMNDFSETFRKPTVRASEDRAAIGRKYDEYQQELAARMTGLPQEVLPAAEALLALLDLHGADDVHSAASGEEIETQARNFAHAVIAWRASGGPGA